MTMDPGKLDLRQLSIPPAGERLHLHDGFVTDGTGLTYIGALQDFPERYLRQALCGLEMSIGRDGLIAFLEHQLAVLKRGEA
jgi:hypothetical protein